MQDKLLNELRDINILEERLGSELGVYREFYNTESHCQVIGASR
jgi:hypothetical protein